MILSPTDSRCAGRPDLSPDADVCAVRLSCARYVDLATKGSAYEWPRSTPVATCYCGKAELSGYVAVVVHERNVEAKPDMGTPLGDPPLKCAGRADSLSENTVIGGAA